MTETVRTIPAIQWYVTQANRTPTFGRKAVRSSANMAIAMIKWKSRAPKECRATRSGTWAATPEAVAAVPSECAVTGFAQYFTYTAWTIRNSKAPIADTHKRLQAM